MDRASIDKAQLAQLERKESLLRQIKAAPMHNWEFYRDKGHHHATRDMCLRQKLIDNWCGAFHITLAGEPSVDEIGESDE